MPELERAQCPTNDYDMDGGSPGAPRMEEHATLPSRASIDTGGIAASFLRTARTISAGLVLSGLGSLAHPSIPTPCTTSVNGEARRVTLPRHGLTVTAVTHPNDPETRELAALLADRHEIVQSSIRSNHARFYLIASPARTPLVAIELADPTSSEGGGPTRNPRTPVVSRIAASESNLRREFHGLKRLQAKDALREAGMYVLDHLRRSGVRYIRGETDAGTANAIRNLVPKELVTTEHDGRVQFVIDLSAYDSAGR